MNGAKLRLSLYEPRANAAYHPSFVSVDIQGGKIVRMNITARDRADWTEAVLLISQALGVGKIAPPTAPESSTRIILSSMLAALDADDSDTYFACFELLQRVTLETLHQVEDPPQPQEGENT